MQVEIETKTEVNNVFYLKNLGDKYVIMILSVYPWQEDKDIQHKRDQTGTKRTMWN